MVEVHSDNEPSVAMINQGYSPVREYMRLIRKLFWLAVEGGFELRAVWVPGVENGRADALSRWITHPSIHRSGEHYPLS